ncbi:hypothetical protein [Kineococcus arenarius]|uniref:hypothetical protein n=1 Tax=unclassified Kineococcus TaxID=2621656 RepID=UPI003D7CF572
MTLAGARVERRSAGQKALTGDDALQIAFDALSVDDLRFAHLDASSSLALQLQSVFGVEAERAVLMLIHATAVSFSVEQYRRLPVLRPYAIRDGRKRKGSGGSELWGVPDESGYFSDDNSLLKALPKGMDIVSDDPRLVSRRVTTGWTCCHAWRSLSTGAQASKRGLLNSFVPVVTWLPTSLAHFTDREGSPAQGLLKEMAMSFVCAVPAPLIPYVDRAWSLLVPEGVEQSSVSPRHRFTFSEKFVSGAAA